MELSTNVPTYNEAPNIAQVFVASQCCGNGGDAGGLAHGTRRLVSSGATLTEGLRFLRQLAGLRFGRIASFGVVGGIGAVLNLLIMGALVGLGVHYVLAAIVAAEITIVTNFLMQERVVFHADRQGAGSLRRRFLHSAGFNNADAAARLPLLWLLVEFAGVPSLLAQAGTLVGAFFLRYFYHSRVVYAEVPSAAQPALPRFRRPLRRRTSGRAPSSTQPTAGTS